VWFTGRKVSVFPDDRFRDEAIHLELPPSPQLELLEDWDEKTAITQEDLIRTLFHDLAGCVDPSILLAYRTLNFQVLKNTRANRQASSQSFDNDIVAKVEGDDKPQFFDVNFPLFDHCDFRDQIFVIRVTVEIDVLQSRLYVQVEPTGLTRAYEQAIEIVRTRLNSEFPEGTTLLAGTP
jgi:hypothetical protein